MTEKKCTACKETKPVDEFNKNRSKHDGLSTECRLCVRNANKRYYGDNLEKWTEYHQQRRDRLGEDGFRKDAREKQARHRASPGNTIRIRYRKTRYGLTPAAYDAMVVAQGGVCAICRRPPSGRWPTLHIDHCHQTGRVRGLLCFPCNAGLGSMGDSLDRLLAAAEYLRRSGEFGQEKLDAGDCCRNNEGACSGEHGGHDGLGGQ